MPEAISERSQCPVKQQPEFSRRGWHSSTAPDQVDGEIVLCSGSMNDYSKRLEQMALERSRSGKDASELIRLQTLYGENKDERLKGLNRLVELDLPRYRVVTTTVQEWLDDPESILKQLDNRGDLFYPKLVRADGRRKFQLNIKQSEITPFVETWLASGQFSTTDTLLLSEYLLNEYGMHITIDKRGEIYVELARGDAGNLAYGFKTPLIRAGDSIAGLMQYKLGQVGDDELPVSEAEFQELKTAINYTLACLPKVAAREGVQPTGIYSRFAGETNVEEGEQEQSLIMTPGYYEVALGHWYHQDEESDGGQQQQVVPLLPVFVDARDVTSYQVANRNLE